MDSRPRAAIKSDADVTLSSTDLKAELSRVIGNPAYFRNDAEGKALQAQARAISARIAKR